LRGSSAGPVASPRPVRGPALDAGSVRRSAGRADRTSLACPRSPAPARPGPPAEPSVQDRPPPPGAAALAARGPSRRRFAANVARFCAFAVCAFSPSLDAAFQAASAEVGLASAS